MKGGSGHNGAKSTSLLRGICSGLIVLSLLGATVMLSRAANRDLSLDPMALSNSRAMSNPMALPNNGKDFDPLIYTQAGSGSVGVAASEFGKNSMQLVVCLRYMEKNNHGALRDLMAMAISLNKTTASELEITEVEALGHKVDKLRFADVAELCVHAAKKVIGEKKTAEYFANLAK